MLPPPSPPPGWVKMLKCAIFAMDFKILIECTCISVMTSQTTSHSSVYSTAPRASCLPMNKGKLSNVIAKFLSRQNHVPYTSQVIFTNTRPDNSINYMRESDNGYVAICLPQPISGQSCSNLRSKHNKRNHDEGLKFKIATTSSQCAICMSMKFKK